jgi:hypothetical protein
MVVYKVVVLPYIQMQILWSNFTLCLDTLRRTVSQVVVKRRVEVEINLKSLLGV